MQRERYTRYELFVRSVVQYDGLSLYTQTLRTPINQSITQSRITSRFGESSHDSWMSPRVLSPLAGRPFPHTPTRFTTNFTMHGLTMTSAVVGTKMTTRATSSSSRVSRGALTIVNSGAGPKRVRRATNERARTGERPNARARAGSRGGGRDGDRAVDGWMDAGK